MWFELLVTPMPHALPPQHTLSCCLVTCVYPISPGLLVLMLHLLRTWLGSSTASWLSQMWRSLAWQALHSNW